MSSAKNADKIIVLDDGLIVEEGAHETLLQMDGYYRHLYLKQSSEEKPGINKQTS